MKYFIQFITLGFLIPVSMFFYVLFNGYPEPTGLYIGIVCGLLGLYIAGKEISRCLR